ncbi:MAG: hypothetical protein K2K41_02635 [Ruminiclostridium sp.]|nr:hypothetical protein [Ruminiclostridium sp.]
MLSIEITKGKTTVFFDASTDVLYDRLAFVGVKDIPISGTDEATVKVFAWNDEKLSDMIKDRLSDSDKMSEVNELCRKVTYLRPADEKALIERFEKEDAHGAAQMIEIVDEMGLEVVPPLKRYDYVEGDEDEPVMNEQNM